jgi:hypothetical protein
MRLGYDAQVNDKGERLIWLEPHVLDKLRAQRGPGRATATRS